LPAPYRVGAENDDAMIAHARSEIALSFTTHTPRDTRWECSSTPARTGAAAP
jgi:hypothetical protein